MTIPEPLRVPLALVLGALAFVLALYVLHRIGRVPTTAASLSLEDTLSDIKSELQKLANLPGEPLGLLLTEVEVTLQVQEEKKSSGEVELAVPVFDKTELKRGRTETRKASSKVSVVLVPPKGDQLLSTGRESRIDFAELLASTRAALRRSMENEPRLDAKTIEVELSFILVAGEARSAGVQVKVVSVGAAMASELTTGNKVILRYLNPVYAKKEESAAPIPP